MVTNRPRWRWPHAHRGVPAFLFVALGASTGAATAADDTRVQVRIDAHTQATATLVGTRLQVVLSPGGSTQWLDADVDDGEGGSDLRSDDYDFDGHRDLAVTAMLGQVNEATLVFLFDPVQRRFQPLAALTRPAVQCDGLWNLTPDAKERSLTSACRSGPMWYSDQYRYSTSRLYVYRSQQPINAPDIQALLGRDDDDAYPLSVWSTFDPQGVVIATAIGETLESPMPVQLRVQVARLPFYATATASTTRRYLVRGDRADALDVSADATRIKLRYRSATAGDMLGWVSVDALRQQ
ncbi:MULTISPECIES: XAC2610-related protein [Xanthomonas]|uniref:XAC2610-related protein n=1 Tax=Xanthomonas cannabis TaxID=1885674 RepID=UPI0016222C4B